MNNRSRWVPPLAAALLLGGALALRFLWPTPDTEPSVRRMHHAAEFTPVAPAPVSSSAAPVKAAPVKAQAHAEVSEGPRATVVPIQPGDEVPQLGVENVSRQPNDPIEPEKPQTAAWRHGKMVRITELLGRDVERLEQERKQAEARGDEAEAKRLEVQLARHRARLGQLREETAALAEAARQEQPE
jgi:hypothetical protein